MQQDAGSSATAWSVPGSQAEPQEPAAPLEPPPPGGQPSGAPAAGGPAGTRGVPPSFAATGPLAEAPGGLGGEAALPQLRLHPMTLADILDGAFSIIKARPARILGVTAVFVVPVHLLIAFLERNAASAGMYWEALTSDDPAVVTDATQNSSGAPQFWATVASWFLPALALMLVAVAVAHLVAGWATGHDHPAGRLLAVAGRRWWAVLASFVAIHVLEGLGLLGCYIGTAFVMAVFVVTAPVIGAEGAGPLKAMSRAANLSMRRFWPTLGISLAIGLVATLLALALGGLPLLISAFLDFELAWPVQAAGDILGAIVATPFVATATVLLYLDLRIRTEGLDIELATLDMANDAR